jgi:chromosome segregation ATPase
MNENTTKTEVRAGILGLLLAAIVMVSILAISSCSSGYQQEQNLNQVSYPGDKSFSFRKDGSEWRVYFDGNDIAAIYKDDNRISDSEILQYKNMIYDNIDELRSDFEDHSDRVNVFKFNMKKFDDDMEIFRDSIDNDNFMHFKFEFDENEFAKNMEELEKNLGELRNKKIEIYIDSDKIRDHIKDFEEKLKDIPDPKEIDIKIDMDVFKEGMKKFRDEMRLHKFHFDSLDINMDEFHNNMKELKNNLKNLKIETKGFKIEMKNLKTFLRDLKNGLVRDGYLNSNDDELNFNMSAEKMKVNGKEISSAHLEKYKKLYKKHYGKEIEGEIKIDND